MRTKDSLLGDKMLMVVEPEREEPGCNFTLFYAGWGGVGTEVAVGEMGEHRCQYAVQSQKACSVSLSPRLVPWRQGLSQNPE